MHNDVIQARNNYCLCRSSNVISHNARMVCVILYNPSHPEIKCVLIDESQCINSVETRNLEVVPYKTT